MPTEPTRADIVIVGGGIMGASVAFHLGQLEPELAVVVVERDPGYVRASTTLSVGNIRVQFGLKENILASLHAFDVLERFAEDMSVAGTAPDVRLRREGNLFLVSEAGAQLARAALRLQRELGCEVDWLAPEEVERRYPLLRARGLAGATFGKRDGHIDGHAFLAGYRAKSIEQGVVYVENTVTRITAAGGRAGGGRRVMGVELASGDSIAADRVVSCAGAWAGEVARTAGISLPVRPIRRQAFVVDPAVRPGTPLPLVGTPSGLYFRSEGDDRLLVGRSLAEDPETFDLAWSESRFSEILWPELASVAPAFDRLRLNRGWAGLYAVNTLDGNALLGEWPELPGFWLANGFSGHGLQQAPAAGRYLAERLTGRPPTLDLRAFSPRRVLEGDALEESALV